MTDINNPHDKFFKESIKTYEMARHFLQTHLPDDIQARINFESLRPTDQEYIDENLKTVRSDVVYECDIDNQPGFIYFLIEHQSTPDKLLPFRLLYYLFQLLKHCVDHQGYNQLPIVVPLCIYHGGSKAYPYSTDILNCFYDAGLAKQVLFKPCRLIDLTQMTLEDFQQHGPAGLLEVVLQHHNEKQFSRFIKDLIRTRLWYEGVHNVERGDYGQVVLQYLITTCDDDSEHFKAALYELAASDPEHEEDIMSVAQKLKEEGLEEGREEGMRKGMQKGEQKGMQKGMRQTAYRMLQDGMLDETVKRYTGLTDEDIKQLKHNLDS